MINLTYQRKRAAFPGEAWQTPPPSSSNARERRQQRGKAEIEGHPIRCRENTAPPRGFLPKPGIGVQSGRTSVNPTLRNILQNNWPVIFQSVKVTKSKERLKY